MKFNTEKQKLPKLWEKSKKNTARSITQIETNKLINISVEKLSKLIHSQQKFIDLSTEFESLEAVILDTSDNTVDYAWKNWSFRIPLIKEDILNSVFYDIIIRFGNGIEQSVKANSFFRHGMIIDRKEEAGIDFANLNISFVAQNNSGLQEELQVKLVLLVLNPNLYYKQ